MQRATLISTPIKIKVIGLGGAGCNAINRMVRSHVHGVEFIAMNTDIKQLSVTESPVRIQLGESVTHGMGAGGDFTQGRRSAEESRDDIIRAVAGADMVFIAAGMGGGTGTGSAPVVAELAKRSGALTIAMVTKPFNFEGTHRSKVADEGIIQLLDKVDTLIAIPNERLLQLVPAHSSMDVAFAKADEVLLHGVQSITEVITVPGLINLDFSSIRVMLKDAGPAWMSVGSASGEGRAAKAANSALHSPLVDINLESVKGILFNVIGGNVTLFEIKEVADVIRQSVDPQANVMFGVRLDPNMGNELRLTLIATGFAATDLLNWSDKEEKNLRSLENKSDEELDMPAFLRHGRTFR